MTVLLALVLLVAPGEAYFVTANTAFDHCAPDDPAVEWCDGRTASGTPAYPSLRIAACPPEIRFGQKVYVEGLGVFTCLDRGGKIKGHRLDILVATEREAYAITGERRVWRLASHKEDGGE